MAKRIVRGEYGIGKPGFDVCRMGTLFAGQRIKLADDEWLSRLAVTEPLMLMRKDFVLFPVALVPTMIKFFPGELMGTFEVRRLRRG